VTPAPLTLMLEPVKFVPVMVTGTVRPCSPPVGVSAVIVGAGVVTVKVAVADPAEVVIVTV
jgi:hypothetical protein